MYRHFKYACSILLIAVVFSACKNVPDHARYIPKNAIAVFGINSKEIGKKVAWNAITGSKLWEQMQKNMPVKDILKDVEKAGIDGTNTFYGYIVSDKRFPDGNRVTALIPLNNAMKWETYLKKTFPGTVINTGKNRKEAMLEHNIYMAWNEDVLVVMNSLKKPDMADVYDMDEEDTTVDSAAVVAETVPQNFSAELAAEMENTFNISEENSLMSNKRFEKLETKGHDITLWVNYDELMTQYMGSGMAAMTGGISLTNKLWKDAAFTAGWDFEKGCITGDMHYYTPGEMKAIAQEMGKTNTDKEMLERLPTNNINMLVSYHLSTKGLRQMLEELGVLGFMNMALASQEMNADYLFDAVTGDMVMSVNDFKLEKNTAIADSMVNGASMSSNYTPDMNVVFALKINKQENFQKLVQMAVVQGVIIQSGEGVYTLPSSGAGAITMVVKDQYAVISNKAEIAQGYAAGTYKAEKMPVQASKEVYGHPFGMYFNFQSVAQAIEPGISGSPESEAMIAEFKKLLQSAAFSGGEFKGDAFEYKMNVSFVNKEENSLIQLMDFTMRMNQAGKNMNVSLRTRKPSCGLIRLIRWKTLSSEVFFINLMKFFSMQRSYLGYKLTVVALMAVSLYSCRPTENGIDNNQVVKKPYTLYACDTLGTLYNSNDGLDYKDIVFTADGYPSRAIATSNNNLLWVKSNSFVSDNNGKNFNPTHPINVVNPAAFDNSLILDAPNLGRVYMSSIQGPGGCVYSDENGKRNSWVIDTNLNRALPTSSLPHSHYCQRVLL